MTARRILVLMAAGCLHSLLLSGCLTGDSATGETIDPDTTFTGWHQQYPAPGSEGTDLRDIQFLNDAVGFAVGEYGNFFRTDDRGTTWRRVFTGSEQSLNEVFFLNTATGFAAGDGWQGLGAPSPSFRATLIGTRDGGKTWEIAYENEDLPEMKAVQFGDSRTGYAVGGSSLVKTSDGGKNWVAKDLGLGPLNDIHFRSRDTGWASGDGAIHKTNDGGATWHSTPFTGITCDTRDNAIHFVSATKGFLMSIGGCLLMTTDGGLTWSQRATLDWGFKSVSFVDDTLGYAAGTTGGLLKTTDGGESWTSRADAPAGDLDDIECRPSGICHVAANGRIFKFR